MLFASFLLYDVAHVLAAFPRLGGADTALHHVGFLGCAYFNGSRRVLAFPFAWPVTHAVFFLHAYRPVGGGVLVYPTPI